MTEKHVARELHGDGARALTHAACAEVADGRACDTVPVDAVMCIEAAILNRNECRTYVDWHTCQRHVKAFDGCERTDDDIILIKQHASLGGLPHAQLRDGRTPVVAAGVPP